MAKDVIASRTFLGQEPNGREFEITIAVGEPREIELNHWACPLSLHGLHEHLDDAAGGDAWQAIQLAFRSIRFFLQRFLDKGGVLLWPEEREPLLIEELFPDVSATKTNP